MPRWSEILTEIESRGWDFDGVRRKYLFELSNITNRNVIAYYSGWLQSPNSNNTEITDLDMNGFMETVNGLDRSKGLDLIIHTQGGNISASEHIVSYLHDMFHGDIRAIVPQLAMSAGTMIACATKEIIMGKQSALGPTDPQFPIKTNTGYQRLPALTVLEEFYAARKECLEDSNKMIYWHPILMQYNPGLIMMLQNAVGLSIEFTSKWLSNIMFKGDFEKDGKVKKIVESLCNSKDNKEHGRHISADRCKEIGLNITMMESNQQLQEAILSVHHAYIITLSHTNSTKIIENQNGNAFILKDIQKGKIN